MLSRNRYLRLPISSSPTDYFLSMANSMTGFGSAEGSVIGGRMAVDIKSVNHRHFNLQARMPAVVQHLEQALRERMRRRIARGHVNIGVRWIEEPPRALSVRVNVERARAVYTAPPRRTMA